MTTTQTNPTEVAVNEHQQQLTALLRKAEQVAEALLDFMLTRLKRREAVFPGELVQVCRGLHAIARCVTELGRSGKDTRAGLSASQVAQVEAHLRQTFAAHGLAA